MKLQLYHELIKLIQTTNDAVLLKAVFEHLITRSSTKLLPFDALPRLDYSSFEEVVRVIFEREAIRQ